MFIARIPGGGPRWYRFTRRQEICGQFSCSWITQRWTAPRDPLVWIRIPTTLYLIRKPLFSDEPPPGEKCNARPNPAGQLPSLSVVSLPQTGPSGLPQELLSERVSAAVVVSAPPGQARPQFARLGVSEILRVLSRPPFYGAAQRRLLSKT